MGFFSSISHAVSKAFSPPSNAEFHQAFSGSFRPADVVPYKALSQAVTSPHISKVAFEPKVNSRWGSHVSRREAMRLREHHSYKRKGLHHAIKRDKLHRLRRGKTHYAR